MAEPAARPKSSGVPDPDRRYAIRIKVHIEAAVHDAGQRTLLVTLTNLSITGCRIECNEPVVVPGPLVLHIEGIPSITGKTAWQEGKQVGCQFDEPLHPAVCNQIIRSLRDKPRPA